MTVEIGDAMWWRGMRMKVTDVFGGGKFRYETVDALIEEPEWMPREVAAKIAEDPDYVPGEDELGRTRPAYSNTSAVADAKWDSEFGFWFLPGLVGELPEVVITAEGVTEFEDPEIPRCTCKKGNHDHDAPHEAITFRKAGEPLVPYCTNCIMADAAEAS